jgi:hypothetical protein
MVRRTLAALLALALLVPGPGLAALRWKENTPGQKLLRTYITTANTFLAEQGETEVNSLFELYDSFAEMGITSAEDAEIPEGISITVYLYDDSLNTLTLRVNDVYRFPRIAAALLRAIDPDTMSMADALKTPSARAQKAAANPANSFEDKVEDLNGTVPRVYYAYYPDQYHDGENWMQMTIVFPLAEYWDAEDAQILSGETPTKGPDTYSGNDADYEGYFSGDDYQHLEVFSTPTPEPDSAAAEFDPYQ